MPSLPEPPPLPLPHHFHHHHHPKFEFQSIREVPDTHAWLDLHDHPIASEPFPTIDLSNGSDVLHRLAWASETWGAFQVTGHGVPLDLLDRLVSEARRLFALPVEQKSRAARTAEGVTGYGVPRISRFFSKLMWCEGFTIAGSPDEHARKLWPDDHSPFCVVVEAYTKEMKQLAERLMRLLLLSLGLEEGEMKWAGPREEEEEEEEEEAEPRELCSVLQLNSYPACPDPERAMGLAAHTDSSLLTILQQSNASGLQILRPRDRSRPARWVAVPPVPGALVVNVGDLMQILSNGRFKSVVHRAVVNRERHRVSAAYICGPPAHVRVSPARRLVVGPGTAAAYREVTWAEYLGLKGKLFDKALPSIMIHRDSSESEEDLSFDHHLYHNDDWTITKPRP